MAELTGLNDIINRLTGGAGATEQLWAFIANRIGGAAGVTVASQWSSLWQYEKYPNGPGAAPTAAENPTRATAGALAQANPGGGRQKWLVSASMNGQQACTVLLYDRLAHMGGLDGTSVAAQTVGLTLSRYTDGLGVLPVIEIYTLIGVTARTFTLSYTDDQDNPAQVTPAVAIGGTGLREINRLIFPPLAAGDRGCKAVASLTLSASTGTVGNFGVSLIKPLAVFHIGVANAGSAINFAAGLPQVPEIKTDACLALAILASTTTGFSGMLNLTSVEA